MKSSLTIQERADLFAKMTILIKAKSKLIDTHSDFFTPEMLIISLDENLCYICDYIHRPDKYMLVQPTLHYIWADMCIDGLKARYEEEAESGGGGSAVSGNTLTEIKMGNATVKYENDSGASQTSGSYVPAQVLLKNYNRRLQEYRRIS